MRPIIFAAVFLAAAVAAAQTPKAVITGPKESRCGALVVLDATESQGVGRLWLLAVSPEETSFLPVDSGLKCIFASPVAGTYRFVLVVAGTNANGGPAADVATHSVRLTGGMPPPQPPDPVDPDVPTPPGPTAGAVAVVVIRDAADLTVDEAETLSKLRTWSDQNQEAVTHLEFSPEADDSRVKAYVGKIPKGKPLPWVFFSRAKADGTGATILWSGPLGTVDEVKARLQEVAK
jgi:hypothetical protein